MLDDRPSYTLSSDGIVPVLRVDGEIDLAEEGPFRMALEQLLDGWSSTCCADLRAVSFMDSTGVRILLSARELARRSGCELLLLDPSKAVIRTLQLAGVDDLFEVVRPVEA